MVIEIIIEMSIVCIHADNYYKAGETALLLLKGQGNNNNDLEDAIIFCQLQGFLNIDSRWIHNDNKNNLIVQPSHPLIEKIQYATNDPLLVTLNNNNYDSSCIFASSKIVISPTQLCSNSNHNNNGILLELELPYDMLPSYKGLSSLINYYVILIIQYPTYIDKLHYPITIYGSGSISNPYTIKYSSMVAYPVSSLPLEVYLSAPAAGFGSNDISSNVTDLISRGRSHRVTYNIRDREHICSLNLNSRKVCAGQDIQLFLDFDNCVQECRAVRSTLIQSEMRTDGTILQDKAIDCKVKSAEDAQLLNLSLHIPRNTVTSFNTPLFQVKYRIELDFCLEDNDTSNNDNNDNSSNKSNGNNAPGLFESAFSFSIPIDLVISLSKDYSDMFEYQENKHQSSSDIQRIALKLLESDIVTVAHRFK